MEKNFFQRQREILFAVNGYCKRFVNNIRILISSESKNAFQVSLNQGAKTGVLFDLHLLPPSFTEKCPPNASVDVFQLAPKRSDWRESRGNGVF